MAEIKERNGVYTISVYLGRDANGKKIRKNTTFTPTKTTPKAIEKEVQTFALDFERKAKNGDVLSGDRMTFADAVEEWKKSDFFSDLSINSRESYIDMLENRIFPHIGYMKITQITHRHLQKIYNDMSADGKAPQTIRRTNSAVNSVFKFAYIENIISANPCEKLRLPKVELDTDLHSYDISQAGKFLNLLNTGFSVYHPEVTRKNGRIIPAYVEDVTVSTQFKVYFNLSLIGGFRRGEIIALTWNDIDFDKNSISIRHAISRTKNGQIVKGPKTKAGIRDVAMPTQSMNLLRQWKLEEMQIMFSLGEAWQGATGKDFDNNYVFIQTENGLRMDVDTPSHKFKKLITAYNKQCKTEEEKLPLIRLHDLRHTSASILFAQGVDPETVSYRCGHSKTSTTLNIYGHCLPENNRKASDTLENTFGMVASI